MTGSSAMTRRTSSRRIVWVFLEFGSGGGQCAGEPAANLGRNGREQRGEPAPCPAQIRHGENDAGADDADADFAGTVDREHEGLPVETADGAELVARDDRGGVTGQCRGIGREVAQECGDECACGAPQRQGHEKGGAILRKAGGHHHDRHGADHGADHAEPALAQRRAEMRLTDDRRGGPGPERVVELEPERDVECQADRSPQPQTKEQRRTRRPQRLGGVYSGLAQNKREGPAGGIRCRRRRGRPSSSGRRSRRSAARRCSPRRVRPLSGSGSAHWPCGRWPRLCRSRSPD